MHACRLFVDLRRMSQNKTGAFSSFCKRPFRCMCTNRTYEVSWLRGSSGIGVSETISLMRSESMRKVGCEVTEGTASRTPGATLCRGVSGGLVAGVVDS
jgi:hypothetical protein